MPWVGNDLPNRYCSDCHLADNQGGNCFRQCVSRYQNHVEPMLHTEVIAVRFSPKGYCVYLKACYTAATI